MENPSNKVPVYLAIDDRTKIETLNGKKFVSTLNDAVEVFVEAPESGVRMSITKRQVFEKGANAKIKYRLENIARAYFYMIIM